MCSEQLEYFSIISTIMSLERWNPNFSQDRLIWGKLFVSQQTTDSSLFVLDPLWVLMKGHCQYLSEIVVKNCLASQIQKLFGDKQRALQVFCFQSKFFFHNLRVFWLKPFKKKSSLCIVGAKCYVIKKDNIITSGQPFHESWPFLNLEVRVPNKFATLCMLRFFLFGA